MDLLEKHRKTVQIVAIATGAALLGTSIYLFFKKKASDSNIEDRFGLTGYGGSLSKMPNKNSILVKVKISYEGERLALSTIVQIYDAALELVAPQFVKLTKRNREMRRENSENLKKYVKLYDDYVNQLDKVIEDGQRELLGELGIPVFVWDESLSFYMNQENSVLLRLYADVSQKLQKQLIGSKIISKTELKQIMKTEIDLFETEGEKIGSVRNIMKNNEAVMSVLQARVEDQIYREFGLEEEDILSSIRYYLDDSEIYGLSSQLRRLGKRLTGY